MQLFASEQLFNYKWWYTDNSTLTTECILSYKGIKRSTVYRPKARETNSSLEQLNI